jgi:hypothetical protein
MMPSQEAQMIPSQVGKRLSLLADFRQELTSVYIQLRYYAEFALLIAPGVLTPYKELSAMGSALASIPDPTRLSLPNRSISIDKWVARTKRDWKDDDEKARRWLAPPERMKLTHIWENKEILYWSRILSILDHWWVTGSGQLEDITWVLADAITRIISRGKGAFNNLKPVIIEGVDQAFWIVDISPSLTDIPTRSLHAEILTAQLLARQGGGLLISGISNDQVEIQLHMPRADASEAILKDWPLDREIAGRIMDEILYMIALGMREGSQKLDQALSGELDQLVRKEVDLDASDKLRKSIDKLREVEQHLDDWLDDFPYMAAL